MTLRRHVSVLMFAAMLATHAPAHADNCSGLSDCSVGIKIALVLAAILLIVALWQLLPVLAAQAALAGSRAALLATLRAAGVKFTETAVIGIARTLTGRLVWLETGSAAAGLQHIVQRHGAQFAAWGMRSGAQIASFLMNTIRTGVPIATSGGATDYVVRIGGAVRAVRIVVSENGFIVTAFPVPF